MERIETPYTKARKEWDARMGDSVAQIRSWRYTSYILLGICTILVLGIIFYSSQPRRIPYIIEIDKEGKASYQGNIGETNYIIEDKNLLYYLKKFIEDTRSLSSDIVVVKKNWREAYYFLTPTGASILNTYAQEIQPLQRYETQRVDVRFNSVLIHSEKTRQVNWTEFVWNEKGELVDKQVWRGIFKLEYHRPSNEEHLAKNPLGIFIDTFNWTEVK